ncbi:hypothetical protein P7228_09400 [Altererythrobacter arenosus]|uniref:M50 family peptidase n=1 Tax=Altererythrobacter arenosus TaxID=3032592 RepID=A0ABY8FMG0_9SPHN|nr:hypothetical protein [Altererythrobacter sp. CAU 1644]WFL76214.1 hypothetical protein P7228_09400 [Altererythrobacter sp. CAU 1644]
MASWLKAAAWAAILMPLTLVLHEAAHYVGYLIYDLPNPTLSYASGGFEGMRQYWIMLREGEREAAEAIAPIFGVGISALFGPALTFLMGAVGMYLLAARNSIFGGALALACFWRAGAIALLYVLGRPEHTDEAHIAITLGIPDVPNMLAGVAALIAALWLLFTRLGWRIVLAMIVGVGVSLTVWMTALGPLLLPE